MKPTLPTMVRNPHAEGARELAVAMSEARRARYRAEAEELRLAAEWALLHEFDPSEPGLPGWERPLNLPDGVPGEAKFCVPEC